MYTRHSVGYRLAWSMDVLCKILLVAGAVLAHSMPEIDDMKTAIEASAFTCEGKVIGGYYADVDSGCAMFHVCTLGQEGEINDIKFLCLSGTVFDQETRVCERKEEVDCSQSTSFYHLNLDLYGRHGLILDTQQGRKVPSGDAGVIFDDDQLQQQSKDSFEDYEDDYEDDLIDIIHEEFLLDPTVDPTTAITTATTTTTTTTPPPPSTTFSTVTELPALSEVAPVAMPDLFDIGLPDIQLLPETILPQTERPTTVSPHRQSPSIPPQFSVVISSSGPTLHSSVQHFEQFGSGTAAKSPSIKEAEEEDDLFKLLGQIDAEVQKIPSFHHKPPVMGWGNHQRQQNAFIPRLKKRDVVEPPAVQKRTRTKSGSSRRAGKESREGASSTTTTAAPLSLAADGSFSCAGRVIGGFYADVESGCRRFYTCGLGKKNRVVVHTFSCGVGLLFDQATLTCQDSASVDCAMSPSLYYLNDPSLRSDSEGEVDTFQSMKEHPTTPAS